MSNKSVKIKQIRSSYGISKKQLATLIGLGLGRHINREKILNDTPEVRGMIRVVSHLISVEEVN